MVTITKSTIKSATWETIHDRLLSNVTSVTAKVKYTDGSYIWPIKTVTSSFTDKEKTQKSDYPCIVVEPVKVGELEYTFKRKFRTVRIVMEVFSTASEVADKFEDKIIDSIETYRPSLKDLGIQEVKLDGETEDDTFMDRGGIKLHSRTITYIGKYIYDSTQV